MHASIFVTAFDISLIYKALLHEKIILQVFLQDVFKGLISGRVIICPFTKMFVTPVVNHSSECNKFLFSGLNLQIL